MKCNMTANLHISQIDNARVCAEYDWTHKFFSLTVGDANYGGFTVFLTREQLIEISRKCSDCVQDYDIVANDDTFEIAPAPEHFRNDESNCQPITVDDINGK